MKNNRIALYIDLLFCLVIIPLVIMLLPVDKWIVHNTVFLIVLIVYVYVLYFVYRWARLPQMFMQRKYFSIVGLMVVLVGVTFLLSYFPMPAEESLLEPEKRMARLNIRMQVVWFFFLFVTGFSLTITLTFELFRQIVLKHEIQAEKNRAELALYKAQINPHFLFNTLNTLYALVVSASDKTESVFIKFSNILRYMYAQTHSETISLGKEIEYLRQYVDLQSLRLNHHTRVEMMTEVDDEHQQVPSMLFITFVENAFKYGSSSEKDGTIRITIRLAGRHLYFETENVVMRKPPEGSSAIGIENCRRRLELLYPGRFELTTGPQDDLYKVYLHIQLG